MTESDLSQALGALLRTPFGITNVERSRYPEGKRTPDDVIVTHRYVLVLEGGLEYRCEGVATRVEAGEQIFVPAWSRRQWWTTGWGGCELLFCEFATEHSLLDFGGLLLRHREPRGLEKAALNRMLRSWPGKRLPYEGTGLAVGVTGAPVERVQLLLEGELKASLARFWQNARPVHGPQASRSETERTIHPEVVAAMEWLQAHYCETDVLDAFYQWLPLSPNHFRLLFKKAKADTVQGVVTRLRMRRARYLAHQTDRPFKQIASEVGYSNPLFFSRQYRNFWGHSPSRDRRAGIGAE